MMLLYYLVGAFVIAGLTFALRNAVLNPIFALLFLGLETVLNVYAIQHLDEVDSVYFKFAPLGVLLTTVGTIVSYAIFYHSYLYLKRRPNDTVAHQSQYYSSMMLVLACMNITYFSANLGVSWASMEGSTLFMSLLIYHERQKVTLEATWKYIFVSSIGIALAFMGILFLSVGITQDGVTDLNVENIIAHAPHLNTMWLKIAFILMLVGFSAKMGVFPFHTISIDALAVAPPPVTAMIGSILKGIGFISIFRMYSVMAATSAQDWANNVLLIMGTLSIAVSALEVSKVKFFPRLLGYSSVEHMGLILICLVMGKMGCFVAIFHLCLHCFAKAGFFLQMGQAHDIFLSNRIVKCGQYFKTHPIGALVVIFAFLSTMAMPPSGLFMSEFMAFQAIFSAQYIVLGIVLLLLITIILYFFTKDILQLLFSQTEMDAPVKGVVISNTETISQWILLGLVVYLGFFPPDFFLDWIHASIAVIE